MVEFQRRNYCFSFLLGLLLVLALPPFFIFPLIFIIFPFFLYLLSRLNTTPKRPKTKAFFLGWWFGMGYFTGGLYWIANALFVDISTYWWLLPFTLLGLPSILSLYIGATTLITYFCRATKITQWLGFAISWSAFEWLRGILFTGFPWNPISSIWHEQLYFAQSLSLLGADGVGFLTVLMGSLPFLFFKPRAQFQLRPILATGIVFILIIGLCVYGFKRLEQNPTQYTETKLRLVQPNLDQKLKWSGQESETSFQKLLHLSQKGQKDINLILWPETAASFFLEHEPEKRQQMGQVVPPHGSLITGTLRAARSKNQQDIDKWNSIQAIDEKGTILASYDKHHLVPFGEYFPIVDSIPGVSMIFKDKAFSAGPGPQTIGIHNYPPFSPLVCYEIIFSGNVVNTGDISSGYYPEWILNVTNDGWYGYSPGPFQHLETARARAIEEGIPVVRVANTGVSAVFDPVGRMIGFIPLDHEGILDIYLPQRLPRTWYNQWGYLPWLILLLIATGCSVFLTWKHHHGHRSRH